MTETETHPDPNYSRQIPVYQAQPVWMLPFSPPSSNLSVDRDALQELHALVADLPLHAQPHGSAVRNRQVAAVHPVGQDRLRVQGVEHVDAVDPVVVRVKTHEARGRQDARRVEHGARAERPSTGRWRSTLPRTCAA